MQPDEKLDSVAFLPNVGPIFNCNSRVLSRYNIKTMNLPPRKIYRFLQSVKDNLGRKILAVYSIPCESSQAYIWQMGCLSDTRLKWHQQCISLEHWDKSVVLEHSINVEALH